MLGRAISPGVSGESLLFRLGLEVDVDCLSGLGATRPRFGYGRTGLGISDDTGDRVDSRAEMADNGLDAEGGASSGKLEGPDSGSSSKMILASMISLTSFEREYLGLTLPHSRFEWYSGRFHRSRPPRPLGQDPTGIEPRKLIRIIHRLNLQSQLQLSRSSFLVR